MRLARSPARRSIAVLALALPPCACASQDIHQSDRETLFGELRVRKQLSDVAEGASAHQGTHAALGWTFAHGETSEIDFAIHSVTLGLGVDGSFARGWAGAEAGLAWHRTHFDTTPSLSSETMAGPYAALQGGWTLAPKVELGGRAEWSFTIPETSGVFVVEGGVRWSASEWSSVLLGWRYTGYDIRDLDTFVAFDTIELDTSGPVLSIELSF